MKPSRLRFRGPLLWGLKLATTAFLLWLALHGVPLGNLRAALGQIHLPLAIAAIALYSLASIPLDSLRLDLIARQMKEPELGFGAWMRLYLESRPFFYLLPASAGADGLIWFRLRDRNWEHRDCAFLLFLNRAWGMGIWALAGGLSLLLGPGSGAIIQGVPGPVATAWFWISLGIFILFASMAVPALLARWRQYPVKPFSLIRSGLLLASTLLSSALLAVSLAGAARAAGAAIPLGACLGLLAWFNFAMVLPISVGGLGLQEALVLRLGTPLGLPAAPLLAFSALVHLLRLGLVSVGALAYLTGRKPAASEDQTLGLPVTPPAPEV